MDDVASKVQAALLQKQSKDSNIPVEYLERMQALEIIAQEAERTKVEKQVSDDLTSLSEKYNLSKDELRDFAVALSEKGKNPLEVQGVDIESEYIKMHQQDIIDKAVEKALSEDKARRDKADKHAGGKVPHNAGEDKDKAKIETIADLSKALDDLA